MLLSHADGLTLDIPATPALLAAFLVRAVADDVRTHTAAAHTARRTHSSPHSPL